MLFSKEKTAGSSQIKPKDIKKIIMPKEIQEIEDIKRKYLFYKEELTRRDKYLKQKEKELANREKGMKHGKSSLENEKTMLADKKFKIEAEIAASKAEMAKLNKKADEEKKKIYQIKKGINELLKKEKQLEKKEKSFTQIEEINFEEKIRKTLETIGNLLEKLPKKEAKKFRYSEDFKIYKEVLDIYGLK